MKVILVNRFCGPDQSATSRMVTSLAIALQREGMSMHIIASRMDHQQESTRFPSEEVVAGVTMHRLWTTCFGRHALRGRAVDYVTFYLSAAWWLLRNLRAGDICIVCTDPPLLSLAALVPVRLRRAVMINWIMDLFPEIAIILNAVGRAKLTGKPAIALRDWSLRHARCNVTPTRRMADYLRTRNIPAEKIRVLSHWSEGDVLTPLERENNPLRREWQLTDRFVVAYSGNMGRAHEFATIIDAAALLDHRHDIIFLFIGGGYRCEWLREEARRRELKNVRFKPLQPAERLAQTLAVADVHLVSLLPPMEPFIVPSKFFGIAAAGRPTIFVGAPDGEIAQLVKESASGVSVAIGEPRQLAEWIVRLRDDDALRQAMGRNARELFDARFSKSSGVDEWKRLLASIGGRPQTPQASDARSGRLQAAGSGKA